MMKNLLFILFMLPLIISSQEINGKVFENNENFSIIEIQERTLPHTLINRSLLRSIA